MKKILMLLAVAMLTVPGLALAASAVVTTLYGTAQVQTGSAPPRALRQGDEVQQGDTVITGPRSNLVMKFDDGEVVGMTGGSRMTVTAYQYNRTQRTGNVLLSLLQGGMRAITGWIGRTQPESVRYRAVTATIGIRGTDVTIVTVGGNVVVSVTEGAVTFTYGGQTIVIPAGAGAYGADGKITQDAAQAIYNKLPPDLQEMLNGLNGLTDALNRAGPGIERDDTGNGDNRGVTPGTNVPPGGAGGGTSSSR